MPPIACRRRRPERSPSHGSRSLSSSLHERMRQVRKNMSNDEVNVLVSGWFSFSYGHATVGDILACDLTAKWLADAGISSDIALAPPFAGGVDWRNTRPSDYSHVVFVC